MAPAEDLARPPRIPKLTYRNRLPADDSSLISRASSADLSQTDTSVDQRLFTPPSTPFSTFDFDTRSITSSQSASLASSDGSISRESRASSTKKKKNGVLSFLTLKEPSQLAMEQFADAQRKQTAAKSSQSTAGSIYGVSPAKLPPGVPKVNSKWDGIPESAKSSRNSTMSSKRTSTMSSTSSRGSPKTLTRSTTMTSSALSVASTASRGPPNSLASPMHSAIDVREHATSTPTNLPLRSDSPSSASLPEMTCFFPEDPSSSGDSPAFSAEQPWTSPVRLNQDQPQALVTDYHDEFSLSEPDPVTSDEVDAIFRRLTCGAAESRRVYLAVEDEDLDVPDTHGFLFDVKPIMTTPPPETSSRQIPVPPTPPITAPLHSTNGQPPANFSRLRPIQVSTNPSRPNPYANQSKYGAPALPTLYEASIASADDTDAASDTTEIGRVNTRGSTDSNGSASAPSIAPSTAPSVATSFTPSVMSASWYRSSRDRLGLGGRIRKDDVLPWDQTEQEHRGKTKKKRLSVFGRG